MVLIVIGWMYFLELPRSNSSDSLWNQLQNQWSKTVPEGNPEELLSGAQSSFDSYIKTFEEAENTNANENVNVSGSVKDESVKPENSLNQNSSTP